MKPPASSFSSATKALECAIAMQRAFAAHNDAAEEQIKVRIGLNAGEPIAEDDDLFGTAVSSPPASAPRRSRARYWPPSWWGSWRRASGSYSPTLGKGS